jgi:hypothetical protein
MIATFRFTVALANCSVDWLVCIAIKVKGKFIIFSTLRAGVSGSFAFVFLQVWWCVCMHKIVCFNGSHYSLRTHQNEKE